MDISNPEQPDSAAILALWGGHPLTPASIEAAEQVALEQPQVACPVIHRFGPGVCIREVSMPAGTFAIGHHQRFAQLNVFLQGRVTVIAEDGSTSELVAPMCFVGAPGRKVGYIHEDVVWLNVYATDETDVAKIEEHFLDKSAPWTAHHAQQHAANVIVRQADRDDFEAAIAELGVPADVVRAQSENEADQMPFPIGNYAVRVATSPIEGKGLFATADFSPGDLIAPARVFGMRTPAGRYTNHAKAPNARMVAMGSEIWLAACEAIAGCHGGTDGDEITVDYRQSVAENFKSTSQEPQCQE